MLSDYFPSIILASKSPARLQVLKDQGLEVQVCPTDCDESIEKTDPGLTVRTLARRKLDAFISKKGETGVPVLACDTLVWINGHLAGKAHSRDEARKQLQELSGSQHKVYSGYALLYRGKVYDGYDECTVSFRSIGLEELEEYLEDGEWKGAAGSYRVQGQAKAFIDEIIGDVNTVIGLPLSAISDIIATTV